MLIRQATEGSEQTSQTMEKHRSSIGNGRDQTLFQSVTSF